MIYFWALALLSAHCINYYSMTDSFLARGNQYMLVGRLQGIEKQLLALRFGSGFKPPTSEVGGM